MISDIYNTTAKAKQLYLDPRTKIFLCLTVSSIMLVPSDSPIIETLKLIFAILPLAFLVILKKYKMAAYYFVMYLFSAMIALFTQILPGMMMAYFLIVSTTVSEFVAAMDRMHVTKKISMPFSVLFRFFPTIIEEYGHVKDAMMMREVGSIRSPMKMLEYRMVPFLTSIVSIGNDLAASALTRGLNSPVKRTNVCPIGFTWRDGIAFFATICCLIVFIIYR